MQHVLLLSQVSDVTADSSPRVDYCFTCLGNTWWHSGQ